MRSVRQALVRTSGMNPTSEPLISSRWPVSLQKCDEPLRSEWFNSARPTLDLDLRVTSCCEPV